MGDRAADNDTDDQSQDQVPDSATSVRVHMQNLPGINPYTIDVKIKPTTTVQDVLNDVKAAYEVKEQNWPHSSRLKARIKGKWVIMASHQRMADIKLPDTVLQDYSFFVHVPDASLIAVVTYDRLAKHYKVFSFCLPCLIKIVCKHLLCRYQGP